MIIIIMLSPSSSSRRCSCGGHRRRCHRRHHRSNNYGAATIIGMLHLLLLLPYYCTMTMAATLSGYTFLDANLDGMRSTGWDQLKEYGIPQVSLWLFDCNNMPLHYTTTDDLGYYTFDNNLEVGTSYYISAELPNLYSFSPVWIGNTGEEGGGVLTSPGVDNVIDPTTGRTPCFEMPEEDAVASIGLALLGSSTGTPSQTSVSSSSPPTLRPSSTTTTISVEETISPSMSPETNVPTVSPSETPSKSPMQSSSSSSSSSPPTTSTPSPSLSTLSPTFAGIQYATPSIPLQMKFVGIDQLEDVDSWLSLTAQYIESYFNDASNVNDGVYDVMVELFMNEGNSTVFKTRQRLLRGTTLQLQVEKVINNRHPSRSSSSRRRGLQSNDAKSTVITYNQQSTYMTTNPQIYDGMYVASTPFMESADRDRYLAALGMLSPYYKDVTSIEPPILLSSSPSNTDNENLSSESPSSTTSSAPIGQEDLMENDVGTVAVDSSSNSNDNVTESPMLYVIVGATIVGVALLTSIMVYIVHHHRKQKQHRMNHEYMSTVGNGPASSRNSMREEVVVENEVTMDDLESRDDGDSDGDETRKAATAAFATATAVASTAGTSQRRKSLKRSRKSAKSYNNVRRVNDSSLTPIPENPLSPRSTVSASSTTTVVLNILAPPGKLGVIVDTPPQGGCAYVVEIRSSCPIREEIQLDDRIIAVDDKDVQRMSATSICKLLERKSRNAQRKITVLRRETNNNNNIHGIAGNSEHNGSSLHLPNSPMGRKDSNSDHAQASSLAESNTVQEELNVTREERIDIVAPPGRLGVVLLSPDPPETGPSYISSISEDSPLKGEIMMGDKIIAVDDEDVRDMSAMNLSQLLGSKSTNTARKIVVLRQIAANAAAVCGADRGENDRNSSSVSSSTTRVTIVAPAGKLGVVVASNPGSGLAYVSEIKDSCPIRDEIRVGDRILEVDGEDVSKMKAIHISMLIGSKSKNFERLITVLRDGGRHL